MKNGIFTKKVWEMAIDYLKGRIDNSQLDQYEKIRLKNFIGQVADGLRYSDTLKAADRGEFDLEEVGVWLR